MADIYIGNHLSIADGFLSMGEHEKELGGSTFAFFTANPRGGKSKAADPEDMAALEAFLKKEHFGPLVAHAPYTMNLCSAKPEVRLKGEDIFRKGLQKMELLPGNFLNFHPGSRGEQDLETAVGQVADALNRLIAPEQKTTVLLETMAGKGSEVGGKFSELRMILDRVEPEKRARMGVCLDTCHVWDAGYDLTDFEAVLQEFDKEIGLSFLGAVHLNDSKNPCGSHKDRHEKLGQGAIGEERLKRIVCHPALSGLPFILETPNEDEGYRREIQTVRNWAAETGDE